MTTLKSKNSSYGYVEIRQRSDGWYELWVNGVLEEQSLDLSYIEREYAKY